MKEKKTISGRQKQFKVNDNLAVNDVKQRKCKRT